MNRLLIGILFCIPGMAIGAELPGFRPSPWFGEQVHEEWLPFGVRGVANAAGNFDPKKPTVLIIYATPNGNTIEQTLGCAPSAGIDWHFNIQQILGQVRSHRLATPDDNYVLACVEADGLSWPRWKRQRTDGPARVRETVEAIARWLPNKPDRIILAGHSGGGSFLFGFIDAQDSIPNEIERFLFLDANYSYSQNDRHDKKLLDWLRASPSRTLTVIAYDDREVTLNGKPIVGPDGGTFRATERMHRDFVAVVPFQNSQDGNVISRVGMNGQIQLVTHTNPERKILHTALVGEMNGLLFGLSTNSARVKPRRLAGPPMEPKFLQPAPRIPERPADAEGGRAFMMRVASMPRREREAAITKEILRGNIPEHLRNWATVTIEGRDASGRQRTIAFKTMPDYLAIGNDGDFVRVPMTPQSAALLADALGCTLPTRAMVDQIHRAADRKLEPQPLTNDRESVAAFIQHNDRIEQQRAGRKLGELLSGIKKDVVVTNRLSERSNRVAIYGWHKLNGTPIQPLSLVHVDWYVDYSHGIRLIQREVRIDGQPRDIRHVLFAQETAGLLSDEGPLLRPSY